MKRKMWKGRAEPDGVVGMGKNGAMPVPIVFCQYPSMFLHSDDASNLYRGIESTSPWWQWSDLAAPVGGCRVSEATLVGSEGVIWFACSFYTWFKIGNKMQPDHLQRLDEPLAQISRHVTNTASASNDYLQGPGVG